MDAYLGEIRMFGGTFAPRGWFFCDGSLLSIAEHSTLFVLLGTTYGGDGQNTFALPNLQSRIPLHMGTLDGVPYLLGQMGGSENTTLTVNNLPSHTHHLAATTLPGTTSTPDSTVLTGNPGSALLYADTSGSPVTMQSSAVTSTGNSQPFSKLMPYLAINFIICYEGIYPPQN